jgi:Tol biopolymer transport system component
MHPLLLFLFPLALSGNAPAPDPTLLHDSREVHLGTVQKLTHTGSNAEAYWSQDGQRIIFQSTRDGAACDQLFTMQADGTHQVRVSSGKGRVTCGWFLPGDQTIIYASTEAAGPDCPQGPPFTPGKYQWPIFQGYDLVVAKADGSGAKPFLPSPGYDAEATVAPSGQWMVFTSERGGDVDIWRCDLAGHHLQQLTDGVGYDGGAVVSPDSKLIAWRTNYPKGEAATAKYKALLREHLVEPMEMDIWVMNADGSQKRQITHLPGAAFAPIFTPDGKGLLFASNHHDNAGKGRTFDLFRINLDGTGLERITFTGVFNSFPHFSPDGRRLLWVSGRQPRGSRQFDVCVAQWVP